MIRVVRPKRVPAILATQGVAKRQEHCDAYASGEQRFAFDQNIYGNARVKQALIKAQHKKCCFCESAVTHVASGHVEHFRPKAGFRQTETGELEKPGYFWLAYDWTNLLFSCELCNSRFKKNLFPLADEKNRARGPASDISKEDPLFVDPASDDPEKYISFREEYSYAIHASPRGEKTRTALGLDREDLVEMRRDHLKVIKVLRVVRDNNGPHSADAAALLRQFQKPHAQWSAMVRAAST